ncbi:epimerase [uncultured Nocardioides sp.]|uniref:Reductase n=1 Tax=uncultured Nocardioides sp. TaxID=198441 RepID=A0A6J4P351_9ACTN|nr:epimerase [uncultured Nocardioides sp.]CAA9404871.1 MAG: Putative reductase [uncultured Nocardioides sp.]
MRLLVLGGTRFLSRAVAAEAVARGHAVTCACRGVSGALPDGVEHVAWDRADEAPAAISDASWDAVVDVARLPSHVRRAVAATPDAHWVFVSTINVYPDDDTPGTPATLRLHEPRTDDADLATDPDAYGPMKVACEQVVAEGATSSMSVRPGLISGPDDGSGRFAYWPWRLGRGGEVLAPGSPDDPVQIIDVRDLAAWIVDSAEQRRTGTYDGVGELLEIRDLLAQVAMGVGFEGTFTWVDQEFLADQGVEPWAGDDAIPLFLPRPEYDGMMAHDPTPSFQAGLVVRPVAETARDTLAWFRATPDAARSGLSPEAEARVLAAWHARA